MEAVSVCLDPASETNIERKKFFVLSPLSLSSSNETRLSVLFIESIAVHTPPGLETVRCLSVIGARSWIDDSSFVALMGWKEVGGLKGWGMLCLAGMSGFAPKPSHNGNIVLSRC